MGHFPESWPAPERRSLEGRYCTLEPLDPRLHGDQLFDVVSGVDAQRLHRWLADPIPSSRRDFDPWLETKGASADPMFFVVIDRATGRVEGRQSLMDVSTAFGSAEIGHILWGPRIAGTRVASEAFFLMADWIFGLGYRRYQWRCNARNEPSRRAATRFGYILEGSFRQHMVVKDESRDTAWYSILDSEWPRHAEAFGRWLAPGNFDASGRQIQRLEDLRSPV